MYYRWWFLMPMSINSWKSELTTGAWPPQTISSSFAGGLYFVDSYCKWYSKSHPPPHSPPHPHPYPHHHHHHYQLIPIIPTYTLFNIPCVRIWLSMCVSHCLYICVSSFLISSYIYKYKKHINNNIDNIYIYIQYTGTHTQTQHLHTYIYIYTLCKQIYK